MEKFHRFSTSNSAKFFIRYINIYKSFVMHTPHPNLLATGDENDENILLTKYICYYMQYKCEPVNRAGLLIQRAERADSLGMAGGLG